MRLDKEQKKAVETSYTSALVSAPPGSGKTMCIVERVAYLLENKYASPNELMLLTFSRKAAGEMIARLSKRVGIQSTEKMTIGTFHSVALTFLNRFVSSLKADRKTTVYGEWEEKFLLKDVAEGLGFYSKKKWTGVDVKSINAVFQAHYQRGEFSKDETNSAMIFREFLSRCNENQSYTYGTLLTEFKSLLSGENMGRYIRFKHIIVDESHDTDSLQWDIINIIRKLSGASLYIVCDVDQSIYEWRGSVPDYLIEQQKNFFVFHLISNYRSRPHIVQAANNVIKNNSKRIAMTPQMVPKKSSMDEWKGVVKIENVKSEHVADWIEKVYGKSPMDVVVLGRQHFLLKKLSKLLKLKGVDHQYVGEKTSLVNSENFRRYHAFLKLLINPYDNFSFLLIRDIIGIERSEFDNIRLRATEKHTSHFMEWYNRSDDPCPYYRLFEDSILKGEVVTLSDATDHMNGFDFGFDTSEITNFIRTEIHPQQIKTYLDWLALYDNQDELNQRESRGMKLMTIHASKGLEFKEVLMVGCNEKIIPSSQALAQSDIEPERRLFYVGMTRAIDELYLAIRPEEGGHVSRFVREIEDGN